MSKFSLKTVVLVVTTAAKVMCKIQSLQIGTGYSHTVDFPHRMPLRLILGSSLKLETRDELIS